MPWLIFLLPVNLLPRLEHLSSSLTVHQQVVNFFICHQSSVWFSHLSAFTSFWNKPHPLQVVAEFNLQSGTKRLSVLTSESNSHDCFIDSFTPSVIPYVNIFFSFLCKNDPMYNYFAWLPFDFCYLPSNIPDILMERPSSIYDWQMPIKFPLRSVEWL